jgi:hypothetical protein
MLNTLVGQMEYAMYKNRPNILLFKFDSIEQVFPHMYKCLDVWKTSKSFYLETLIKEISKVKFFY